MFKHKKRVIIRVDGGVNIGHGHIQRCLALSEMIQECFDVIFYLGNSDQNTYQILEREKQNYEIINSDDFIKRVTREDIVVIDGYHLLTESILSRVKEKCFKLVCIDDLNNVNFSSADVVINYNFFATDLVYNANENTKVYLGPSYAIINKHFFAAKLNSATNKSPVKVLLTMGGCDPNNISLKFLEAFSKSKNKYKVSLVLGASNSHGESIDSWLDENLDRSQMVTKYQNVSSLIMRDLMVDSDLVFCPASVTSMEAFYLGRPMVTGYFVDNQKKNADAIKRNKIGDSLGDLNLIDGDYLIRYLDDLQLPRIVSDTASENILKGNAPIENIKNIFGNLTA